MAWLRRLVRAGSFTKKGAIIPDDTVAGSSSVTPILSFTVIKEEDEEEETLTDNEEASIVVGRNIPFPVSTGRDNNNNPIVSFQREDVAITLKVTPQITIVQFLIIVPQIAKSPNRQI